MEKIFKCFVISILFIILIIVGFATDEFPSAYMNSIAQNITNKDDK